MLIFVAGNRNCSFVDASSTDPNKGCLTLSNYTISAAAVFLLILVFAILFWRRKSQRKLCSTATSIGFLSKVEYKRLYEATNGFSPTMLIGTGSFGSVYKGILDEEENLVAVKVLNLQKKGADKSFIAECNVLRSARHRNLIKILTCCSSIDYLGNEFKALIFEYMPNGSLDKWLHHETTNDQQSRGLTIIHRLNVAIDVAFALQYLHEHCHHHIVHRDLKPSNVLLDNDLVAHVTDFGLARLISNTLDSSQSQTSTTGIKGTIGYAAPEYAMGGKPSKQGDVYSYGILMLEMFTGRRPTDEIFEDDLDLHSFVKATSPERVLEVVDSTLLIPTGEEERNIRFQSLQKCLVSVLEIGVSCSVYTPKERMKMEDVIKELQSIRKALIDVGIQRLRQ